MAEEQQHAAAVVEEVAEEEVVAVEEDAPLNVQDALRLVMKTSLYHDGLARGLKESVKALDRREAHLCVLSEKCDEPAYKKLVLALCKEHKIPLIEVPDSATLAEWAGLCRYNAEGKAIPRRCSCAVVTKWGGETRALTVLKEHIKNP